MQLDWLDILSKVVEFVVIPLLGYAAVRFSIWINAKTKELQEKAKDTSAKKYLDMLDVIIYTSVLATNQTYVEALKKDGIFDEEAQKKAFQMTHDAVMEALTDEATKYLSEMVKDLDKFINTKIEAQVNASK